MKKGINKLGFTLIELLVVITIIGILAVGAVSVFTTQLQGARDSTRIGDIKIVESALHQLFSDNSEYPAWSGSGQFQTDIAPFISKNLSDPKSGQTVCWASATTNNQACQGYYGVYADSFSLPQAAFKLGIHFEKKTNLDQKASSTGNATDGGNIDNMYEIYAGAGASTGALVVGNVFY